MKIMIKRLKKKNLNNLSLIFMTFPDLNYLKDLFEKWKEDIVGQIN